MQFKKSKLFPENIPDLPTVLLDGEEEASCDLTCTKVVR